MATGSNDKSVKLMKFNAENVSLETPETELNIHDGTIRDCVFMDDVISGKFKYRGGSPGLVVRGGGSCTECCCFESWRHILDGHEIFSH